jgi:GAF domain-containing protein
MTEADRESRLLDALATLVDTMVVEYDVVDLLQMLVDTSLSLFDIAAGGLLLADLDGRLDLVASTSEENSLVETMALSADAGPCIECFRTGKLVSIPDIENAHPGWEAFTASALSAGFRSVVALPLRLRETVIGSLNLFRAQPGELNPRDIRAAQAMADMAAIGILHERSVREDDAVRDQLQVALSSRVVIEQAKGVIAHTRSVGMDEAFAALRGYARGNQLSLREVAQRLVDRRIII